MNKAILSVCVVLFAILSNVKAQEKSEFKPKGQVLARAFVDASTNFGDSYNGANFDITRAYVGYNYKFTPNLQAMIVGDFAAGKDKNGRFTPALKNAFLEWHKNNLTLTAGLMGLFEYRAQESYWGHRYAYKSFQDQYKFGHSADFGIAMKYQISTPIAVDFSWTNGEGYKTLKKNKSNRYELGVSVVPVENLLVRVYADIYNDSKEMHKENANLDNFDNQYTYCLFVGYKNKNIKAGLEYNYQVNTGLNKDKNQTGYSAYCTAKINKKWNGFARFDMLNSKTNSISWNKKDGKVAILGAEYKPCKNVKIAPNFRFNRHTNSEKNNYAFFVNLEFRLR